MVVHLTTVATERATSWQVSIGRGVGGLPSTSIALRLAAECAEVYTLFKADLAEPIGTLPRERMREIDRALGVALGLGG